jgi:hypothetical protein
VGIEVELLKDEADLCAKAGEIGVAIMKRYVIDDNLAILDWFEPIYTSYQSAFTGTTRAADDHHFSRLDMKVNVPEDMQLPEPFVYFLEGYHVTRSSLNWRKGCSILTGRENVSTPKWISSIPPTLILGILHQP